MKIFLDTANVEHIREANSWGILDGVTTNPTLIAKEGRDFLRPWEISQKGTAQHKGLEEFGYLTEDRWLPRMT